MTANSVKSVAAIRGDGFAPGHGGQCHENLNGTASGGVSPLFIVTSGRELKKMFRFELAT